MACGTVEEVVDQKNLAFTEERAENCLLGKNQELAAA